MVYNINGEIKIEVIFMRILYISIFALLMVCLGFLSFNNGRFSVFTIGYAHAQDESNQDDENTDDALLWPFVPYVEEEEDTEEYVEEEEPSGDEEQAPNEESQNEENPEEPNQEPVEEQPMENPSQLPDTDWTAVPGVKVPFFFLVDENDQTESKDVSTIANLKARKYAGEIISGISFVCNIDSGEVYLSENVTEIPENVRFVEETRYVGVIRYDYEVAVPEAIYKNLQAGRAAVVSVEISNPSVSSAYESARSTALKKAVQNASQHVKSVARNQGKHEVTGTITGWEIVNQGWVMETESFLIQMRAWVGFDGI